MREISLRPYSGRLFIVQRAREFDLAHKRLFKVAHSMSKDQAGRVAYGPGDDGMWTYLVWGDAAHTLAHEIAHVVLHLFERCGIDPREGNGEPFCYMLSQLLLEAAGGRKKR